MYTLRDTGGGSDIIQIDPGTLRERPSLWVHPTAILLEKVGVIVFAWAFMVIPGRWITWWEPYEGVQEAIWGVVIGLVAGLPLAWYRGFIVGRFRTRNAAFYATRGGTSGNYEWRCPGVRAVAMFSVLAMVLATRFIVGVDVFMFALAGWVLPSLFSYGQDRQVHELAWQIIRQAKTKPAGEE